LPVRAQFWFNLILQRWIGAPDFPSESAGTGLTNLDDVLTA